MRFPGAEEYGRRKYPEVPDNADYLVPGPPARISLTVDAT